MNIKPSATAAVSSRARELKASGRKVFDLGAGEPDFDTPDHIKIAAKQAIDRGYTKYTSVDGTRALKEAVIEKLRRDNDLEFTSNEISIGSGASQVIFNAFFATLEPGDEVIIPAPHWVSYPEMVALAGGKPVIAPCSLERGFKLSAEKLSRLVTKQTRWMILNSPNNPTGAVYSKEELEDLATILRNFPQIGVISDDLYEHLIYRPPGFASFANVGRQFKDRVLVVNGVSKSYAMTGWRIGFGAGPEPLIRAMAVVQSKCTSSPSSVSQAAAVEALLGPQEFIGKMKETFQSRRELVASILNEIEGVECELFRGGLSVFPSFSGLLGRSTPGGGGPIESDSALANYFLDCADVAVVPGTAFGAPGFLRISLGCPTGMLEEACIRLRAACSNLS